MSTGSAHTALVNEILLFLGQQPDVHVEKRTTGAARAIDNPNRIVAFGQVGAGDIFAAVQPYGRRLEIEVKTGKGRQSAAQLNFQRSIERVGGVYVIARSLDDVQAALGRMRGAA